MLNLLQGAFGAFVFLFSLSPLFCHGKNLIGDSNLIPSYYPKDFEARATGEYELDTDDSLEQDETRSNNVPTIPFPLANLLKFSGKGIPRQYLELEAHKQQVIPQQQYDDYYQPQEKRLPHLDKSQPGGKALGFLPNFGSNTGRAGRQHETNYNFRGYSGLPSGRHAAAFYSPVSPRKRQILFRQCFFNPISCF